MSTNFRTLTIFYLTLTKPSFSIFYHCVSLCFESTAFHKISPVFLWKVNSGSRLYNFTILLFCCHVKNSSSIVSWNFSPVLPWRSDLTTSCLSFKVSLFMFMLAQDDKSQRPSHFYSLLLWLVFYLMVMYIMAQMLDYFYSILTSSPDMQSKI